MSQTDSHGDTRRRKGGWRRASFAVLAAFLGYLALALIGVVPQSGALAAIWMPFAAVAGWFAYRGTI